MRVVAPSKVYRLFYPSVPAVVSASFAERVSAMPVVSLVSLSNEPALVGFSSSPGHETFGTAVDAGRFSVAWLDRRFTKNVVLLGTKSGSDGGDKLESAGLSHRPGSTLGTPVIQEASAFLECRFVSAQRVGDHRLVTGEVKAARAVDDFGEYWGFKGYRPILYSGLGRPTTKSSR